MSEFENPDPRGEYVRECPYCFDVFTAEHMHQKYCPEKNNRKDYCKNRHKRVLANLKKNELCEEQEEYLDEAIDDPVDETIEIPFAEPQINMQVYNNTNLIGAHLGFRNQLKLNKDYLKDKGLVYEAYDERHQIPGTELYLATYGPYAIAWSHQNNVVLTHKKQIPWLTK